MGFYNERAAIRRKRGLLMYCWRLCHARGIPIDERGLVEMVADLSGHRMNKDFAYSWLETHRKTHPPLLPLPGFRLPRLPPSLKEKTKKTPTFKAPKVPLKSDEFYASPAWKEVRYLVIKRSDGRCSACGRSKAKHGVTIHVDHVEPRSKRPELSLEISNLQVLCEDCNLGKSNRDATDWR